jgi:hypothetical protein
MMTEATSSDDYPLAWTSVDSQADLDRLDKLVCWEDSRTVEYYGTQANASYFPPDTNRSGHQNKNVHVLCEVSAHGIRFLELALIDCDWLAENFLENISLAGRVDTLKRVEVWNSNKSTLLRCSRLLYRFLPSDDVRPGSYFREAPE